jgi:hypothetical protein
MTTKSNPFTETGPAHVAPGSGRAEAVKEDAMAESSEVSLPPDLQGRWVAWDENQEKVLAVADTYPELMESVQRNGLADPIIERAPGFHPTVANMPFKLLDGESSDILKDVGETIPNADEWLDTPNTRLGCHKPRDLIGTAQEQQLRYLLRGIWSGITS